MSEAGWEATVVCRRAPRQWAPTRPLALQQWPITVSCQGQIFMSQWGLQGHQALCWKHKLSSLAPCDHTRFLSVGGTNITPLLVLLFPQATASAKSSVCVQERTKQQPVITLSLKAASSHWRLKERDRRKKVKWESVIKRIRVDVRRFVFELFKCVCVREKERQRQNIQPLNQGLLFSKASTLAPIHKQSTQYTLQRCDGMVAKLVGILVS